jgi:glycosyltransferase involved in cell wall biosynthesis
VKVTYVTTYDAKDVRQWSGLGFYIAKALVDAGLELQYCGPLKIRNRVYLKNKDRIIRKILKKNFDVIREPRVVKHLADQISAFLEKNPSDIVFCPSSIPIALLKTKLPIVFYTDANFAGVVDFYPEYSNYLKRTFNNAHKMEDAAIKNADTIIYSSSWAAETAVKFYNAQMTKIRIIPFGANLSYSYSKDEVDAFIRRRLEEPLHILFLGLSWERKGGDTAFQIVKHLNAKGIKAKLSVVGCSTEIYEPVPDWLDEYGFVNKATERGRIILDNLMKRSHLLLLPSRADCTPVVFSEASSYGIPSISTKVGGIPLIIKDGVNGMLFDQNDGDEKYVEYIESLVNDKGKYRDLALSAYDEYRQKLNWESIGQKIRDILEETINKHKQ